jgi:hypothetical protein
VLIAPALWEVIFWAELSNDAVLERASNQLNHGDILGAPLMRLWLHAEAAREVFRNGALWWQIGRARYEAIAQKIKCSEARLIFRLGE